MISAPIAHPNLSLARPCPTNIGRMEVVGWSPSEEFQDSVVPPQAGGWSGVEDRDIRCVLANPSTRIPLTYIFLSSPASTPALRPFRFQTPLPLASSLPLSTNAVSKIRNMSGALATRLSSSAVISPKNISIAAARSVHLAQRMCPYPRGPERHGTT